MSDLLPMRAIVEFHVSLLHGSLPEATRLEVDRRGIIEAIVGLHELTLAVSEARMVELKGKCDRLIADNRRMREGIFDQSEEVKP